MHKSYAFNFDNLNSDILSRLINHASELGGNEVTPVSALGRILELPCSHFFGDSLGVGSASGMSRKSPPPSTIGQVLTPACCFDFSLSVSSLFVQRRETDEERMREVTAAPLQRSFPLELILLPKPCDMGAHSGDT